MKRVMAAIAGVTLGLGLAGIAPAPVISAEVETILTVNNRVITRFEFEQRRLFLQLIGITGDLDSMTEAALIDERLQLAEGDFVGVRISAEAINRGVEEFARRGGLSAQELVDALTQNGVATETLRDFVRAGLVWREAARARWSGAAPRVADADVDRALAITRPREVVRVALSEIVVPISEPALADRVVAEIAAGGDFAEAARTHSLAPSAERGGVMEPIPLEHLAPEIGAAVATLQPGQITRPIPQPDGLVIYQLRGSDRFARIVPEITEIDFATVSLPAGADAAPLAAEAGGCARLPGAAATIPGAVFARERRLGSEIGAGRAADIARLDPGEGLLRSAEAGGGREFLMLCARRLASGLALPREEGTGLSIGLTADSRLRAGLREGVEAARLDIRAARFLEELRANARITRP
jgi:peptidyl-prolyl cis-trans isomerase SurA